MKVNKVDAKHCRDHHVSLRVSVGFSYDILKWCSLRYAIETYTLSGTDVGAPLLHSKWSPVRFCLNH